MPVNPRGNGESVEIESAVETIKVKFLEIKVPDPSVRLILIGYEPVVLAVPLKSPAEVNVMPEGKPVALHVYG